MFYNFILIILIFFILISLAVILIVLFSVFRLLQVNNNFKKINKHYRISKTDLNDYLNNLNKKYLEEMLNLEYQKSSLTNITFIDSNTIHVKYQTLINSKSYPFIYTIKTQDTSEDAFTKDEFKITTIKTKYQGVNNESR